MQTETDLIMESNEIALQANLPTVRHEIVFLAVYLGRKLGKTEQPAPGAPEPWIKNIEAAIADAEGKTMTATEFYVRATGNRYCTQSDAVRTGRQLHRMGIRSKRSGGKNLYVF